MDTELQALRNAIRLGDTRRIIQWAEASQDNRAISPETANYIIVRASVMRNKKPDTLLYRACHQRLLALDI